MALIGPIVISTPCGDLTIYYNVPFNFPPTFSINIFPLPIPPRIWIPLPDCSLLNHLKGSAPEPAEDSTPTAPAPRVAPKVVVL